MIITRKNDGRSAILILYFILLVASFTRSVVGLPLPPQTFQPRALRFLSGNKLCGVDMRNNEFMDRCRRLPFVYDTQDPEVCISKKPYDQNNKKGAQCDHLLELQSIAQ